MKEENKKCSRCRMLNRYFVKGVNHLHATEFGLCFEKREIVTVHDTCERFQLKVYKRFNHGLRYKLSGLLAEISEIRNIIEAEYAENQTDESL